MDGASEDRPRDTGQQPWPPSCMSAIYQAPVFVPTYRSVNPDIQRVFLMPTDYIAPFALWIVIRHMRLADGSHHTEPAWVRSEDHRDLVVFVSRLHAYLYATLRNIDHTRGESDGWQCIPLSAFDLCGCIREADGPLKCAMAFSFECDATGALIIANGAPRLRFVELTFNVPNPVEGAVFNFSQGAFDVMREQWEHIGAYDYPQSVERIDAMDDVTFAHALGVALQAALVTRAEYASDHWTVYDADAGYWISSPVRSYSGVPATRTVH